MLSVDAESLAEVCDVLSLVDEEAVLLLSAPQPPNNKLEHIIDRALLIKGKTIEGDYRLETIREQSRKLQLVFRSKQIPQKQPSRWIASLIIIFYVPKRTIRLPRK